MGMRSTIRSRLRGVLFIHRTTRTWTVKSSYGVYWGGDLASPVSSSKSLDRVPMDWFLFAANIA
jgi:hypothetical protein